MKYWMRERNELLLRPRFTVQFLVTSIVPITFVCIFLYFWNVCGTHFGVMSWMVTASTAFVGQLRFSIARCHPLYEDGFSCVQSPAERVGVLWGNIWTQNFLSVHLPSLSELFITGKHASTLLPGSFLCLEPVDWWCTSVISGCSNTEQISYILF